MPIYEYECGKCGEKIEVIQKFSDEPLKVHEACGGPLTKLISAAGFQFKGTGWYVTDYARKSGQSGTESTKDAKKDSQDTSSNGNKEGSNASKSVTDSGKGEKSPTSGTTKD